MKLFVEILFNLGTIASLGIVSSILGANTPERKRKDVFQGLLFGLGAVIGMLRPVSVQPGLFFDGRSVMISLAGLFFGPVAGLISALMAIVLRVFQGGIGTLVGVLVSIASALWGIMVYLWYKKTKETPSALQLYAFGVLVHITMVLLMFTVPTPLGWNTVRLIAFPVLSIYPAATLLIGLVLNMMLIKERMNAQVQKSEELLKSSQGLTKAGGWEWDIISQNMFWTEQTYIIHGLDPKMSNPMSKSLIEQSISCYHPLDRPRILKSFQECQIRGKAYDLEFEITSYDGQKKWIQTTAQALRDRQGNIVKVLGNIIDISERKQQEKAIRESQQKYYKLFSSMTESFVYLKVVEDDLGNAIDFEILELNDSFESLCGIKKEELVNKSINKALPGSCIDGIDWFEVHTQAIQSRKSFAFEYCMKEKNKWFSISVYSPQAGYFATLFHDITQQKLAEESLNELNMQLESKVNMRTRDLEESNKALQAFSYSVSHDLRAPLRAINGFSNILLSDFAPKLGTEGRRLLSVISDNAVKMDDLINGLLSMAKVAKSELQKSIINTHAMVLECLQSLVPEGVKDRYIIDLEELPEVYGDPVLIRQVWYNLIENALKFSQTRDQIRIKISGKSTDQFVEFGIRDNGVGFSSEHKDKLFHTFQRLHHPSEFEGTGIGLALVERIIQKHGGKVWAEGEPDQGARFFFSLPKA
jgi:signal transduction histidine kinase